MMIVGTYYHSVWSGGRSLSGFWWTSCVTLRL